MVDDLTARVHALLPELFNRVNAEVLTFHQEPTESSKYKLITAEYRFLK